ncbi:MAG: hypothetical protein WD513_06440 [Balneolaceae bacterium]
MKKDDIFISMIKEELNQFNHFYLYREKQMIKDGEFEKLANHSLKQTRFFGFLVILMILIFSFVSVYQFVQFGTIGSRSSLMIGTITWGFVILFTFIYSRDIVNKKKTMERILKLLEVRREHYQT